MFKHIEDIDRYSNILNTYWTHIDIYLTMMILNIWTSMKPPVPNHHHICQMTCSSNPMISFTLHAWFPPSPVVGWSWFQYQHLRYTVGKLCNLFPRLGLSLTLSKLFHDSYPSSKHPTTDPIGTSRVHSYQLLPMVSFDLSNLPQIWWWVKTEPQFTTYDWGNKHWPSWNKSCSFNYLLYCTQGTSYVCFIPSEIWCSLHRATFSHSIPKGESAASTCLQRDMMGKWGNLGSFFQYAWE